MSSRKYWSKNPGLNRPEPDYYPSLDVVTVDACWMYLSMLKAFHKELTSLQGSEEKLNVYLAMVPFSTGFYTAFTKVTAYLLVSLFSIDYKCSNNLNSLYRTLILFVYIARRRIDETCT